MVRVIPLQHDIAFAAIIAWLKAHGLEMHTDRKGGTWVCPKRQRLKRANGGDVC